MGAHQRATILPELAKPVWLTGAAEAFENPANNTTERRVAAFTSTRRGAVMILLSPPAINPVSYNPTDAGAHRITCPARLSSLSASPSGAPHAKPALSAAGSRRCDRTC